MDTQRIIDYRFAPDVRQTCIGLVDDPFKTIVREDGSLNYRWFADKNQFVDGTVRACEKRVLDVQEGNMGFRYRCVPRFYHRDRLVKRYQEFGDPQAAIVETVEDYEHCSFGWKAFGHRLADGTRLDILLYYLSAKENFGHARDTVYLQTMGEPFDPPETLRSHSDAYKLPNGDATVPAPVALYTPIMNGDGLPLDMENAFLHAGERWEGAFALVYAGRLEPRAFTLDFAGRCLAECAAYWKNSPAFRNDFRVPDRRVQRLLTACGRNILQAREIVDDIVEFHVGPTIYRGLWVFDGYYFAECGYMMGRDDEAWQGLLAVLKRVKPDGSIRILPDHHKETAVALSSIVRQCELRNDDDRLRELWPLMLRGLDYLIAMRDESYALGRDYPAYGLFPPAFGDGGIHGPEPEYTTPLNVLVGVKDAARAGKRLGLPGWERFDCFAGELNDVLQVCMKRDRKKTPEGLTYLPLSMASRHPYKPQTGVQTLCRVAFHGAFSLDDPIIGETADLLCSIDRREGLPESTGWRADQSLYAYAAGRFGELMLLAGRPEKAVDYLYAFANHASPAGTWREEQPVKETTCAEICGDMPHNWASVEFIRLVRTLLVLEWDGGMALLPGLPKEWLPTAERDLLLTDTPTAYGKVTLHLTKSQKGYCLEVQRKPGNQEPRYVTVRWPSAPRLDGELLEKAGEGCWRLPLQTGRYRIELDGELDG